jgi:nuclear transcription Y subunit beta
LLVAHTKPQSIASEKCHQEKRKTVNGEDILFAMTSLGFENYAEALKIYLAKYREVCCNRRSPNEKERKKKKTFEKFLLEHPILT